MKLLFNIIIFFNILPFSLKSQSDCKLLKPGKIITTKAIFNNQIEQQHVISIIDAEAETNANNMEVYNHPSWTCEQIGTITKSVYDKKGNIYVAASSLYNEDSDIDSYRYGDIGGGIDDLKAAGTIYKIDAYTGQATAFVNLPQQRATVDPVIFITFSASRKTGPGIADICYNYKHKQIIAANNEDGIIYQISKYGNLIDTFDPGLRDDGAKGFAPINERITAIETSKNKIYFAVRNSKTSYIASVKITNYGCINKNSTRLELILSDIDEVEFPEYPITNISFLNEETIAITQSEMLNEVTKSSRNIPTIILQNNYWQWDYVSTLNGSTEQKNVVAVTSLCTKNTQIEQHYGQEYYWLDYYFQTYYWNSNTINNSSIYYIGTDAFDKNYLITTNLDELVLRQSKPILNFQQSLIPGFLGKTQSINVVNRENLYDYGVCDNNLKIRNTSTDFSVFPNPCQNYFYVNNSSTEEIENIEIYNSTGQLVKKITGSFSQKNMINELPGIYIVAVKTKTKVNIVKLLIAK